ncbi:MAG: efflux RND transporter periplasmic adaptor subunit [Pseudomonadota bacterium]
MALFDTARKIPSLLRRGTLGLIHLILTLAVIAGAVFAVQMGADELTRRAEAAPAPEPAPVMPVTTQALKLETGYAVSRSFVGQVEPRRTVAVSFELSGRLNAILVDEGDYVTAGQHIATLDTRLLNSERARLLASQAALEAQLRFALQTVERQTELSDRGFASQAALDEALARSDELRSRIGEVEAALDTNTIQAEKSKLFAPFAGQITERLVDGGESVAPGQGLVELVEDGAAHLRVGVPLDFAATDLAKVTVDLGGESHGATLITLRPDVDPVTRTRTAIFAISGGAATAFGQTARLVLSDRIEEAGLWVPVTTLKEGLRGQWTLLSVDANNVVRALSVQVVHTQGNRVFVRGAFPAGTKLLATGPQRVTIGQTVDPRPVEATPVPDAAAPAPAPSPQAASSSATSPTL